jgi:heterodisulfide reductase subunit C
VCDEVLTVLLAFPFFFARVKSLGSPSRAEESLCMCVYVCGVCVGVCVGVSERGVHLRDFVHLNKFNKNVYNTNAK